MKKIASKGKDLDPLEKEAKMGVIKELSRQAGSMMGDKVHPLKKVSVASDSKEGLKEGLEKAAGLVEHADMHEHDPEKLVEQAEEELGADLDKDNEEGESSEHAEKVGEKDMEDCSPEELDAKIAELQALKAKKQAKV
jgi:hypothetical protein